jgi:hypothetical protein
VTMTTQTSPFERKLVYSHSVCSSGDHQASKSSQVWFPIVFAQILSCFRVGFVSAESFRRK